jgi:hypothetical protein
MVAEIIQLWTFLCMYVSNNKMLINSAYPINFTHLEMTEEFIDFNGVSFFM